MPSKSAQVMAAAAAISAKVNGKRTYQRGLSKHIMKLKRYSASGRTQRKGITATSWHILLVVARSRAEAQAGSRSQRSAECGVEGGERLSGRVGEWESVGD